MFIIYGIYIRSSVKLINGVLGLYLEKQIFLYENLIFNRLFL